MIEILRGQSERLILQTGTDEGPKDAVSLPTVEIYDEDDTLIISGTSERIGLGEYAFNTPLSLSQGEGEYRAVWYFSIDIAGTIEDGTWEQILIVTTPYTTPAAVRDRYPNDANLQAMTDEELRDAERTVRHVINSYVGQSFTLELNRTYEVRGRGINELYLPHRIVNLYNVQDLGGRVFAAEIDLASRFALRKTDDLLPYSAYTDGQTQYGVPIRPAYSVKTWREGIYLVRGDWGWKNVPREVVEAAVMLVRDSANPDSKYFDMYVDNIRASDWRMEFAKTGDRTTGNAKADLLLSRFHTGNWMIL